MREEKAMKKRASGIAGFIIRSLIATAIFTVLKMVLF